MSECPDRLAVVARGFAWGPRQTRARESKEEFRPTRHRLQYRARRRVDLRRFHFLVHLASASCPPRFRPSPIPFGVPVHLETATHTDAHTAHRASVIPRASLAPPRGRRQ